MKNAFSGGDITELETTNKTSLVAAINEINDKATGGTSTLPAWIGDGSGIFSE